MIDSKIGGEKLEYSIYREASKITVLSSGKIDISMNILSVKKSCLLIKV